MNDINRLISQQCPSAVSFGSVLRQCPSAVSFGSALRQCPLAVSFGSVAKVPCRMYQLIINKHKIFDDSCRFYIIYQYAIKVTFFKCIIIIYI